MLDFKVGDFIKCHSVCVMSGSERVTTTIGKSYKIIRIYSDYLFIMDDENDEHSFKLSNYKRWFNDIKSERIEKLNRINKKLKV